MRSASVSPLPESGSSPLLHRSNSQLSFAEESEPANKTEHRKGTISMSVLVQAFLILSLVLIVLSISLLFRFLSVVAVDRVGAMYFDAAAAGVRIQMDNLVQTHGEEVGRFVVEELQFRKGGDKFYSSGKQLCSQVEHEWEAVRMYHPLHGQMPPSLSWGENCTCFDYVPSVNTTYLDLDTQTNKTKLDVDLDQTTFCDRSLLGLSTTLKVDSMESDSSSTRPSETVSVSPRPHEESSTLSERFLEQVGEKVSFQSVLSPNNGSLLSLVLRKALWVAIDQQQYLQRENPAQQERFIQATSGHEVVRNISVQLSFTWQLPSESFVTVLDSVHYAQGSEGITTYFLLDFGKLTTTRPAILFYGIDRSDETQIAAATSRAEQAVLIQSPLRPKAEEGILSAETATRFPVGVDNLPWIVAVEAGNSVVQELRRGTYVVVVISLAITLAVAMAAVLGLRVVLTPLGKLRNDMMAAAQLKFDGLVLRHSFLREITEMNTSFALMVSRLRSYRPMLMELFEGRSRSRTGRRSTLIPNHDSNSSPTLPTDGEGDSEDEWEHRGRHQVKVSCRFVTRRREVEKKRVGFEFTYHDGDSNILEKFTQDCLRNLGESEFEVVALFSERSRVSSTTQVPSNGGSGLHLAIKSSRQLEQLLANSPGEMHIAVKYAGVKTLLSPFCLFIDLVNLALNLGIIFGTIFIADNNRAQRLSVYLFTGLYSFAFSVNVSIALYCLKQGQNNSRFKAWLTQAGLEVSVMLLLCSLNTQHVHFLWSQWSFLGALKFNAPRPLELWKACVRWSMFGFFFSDLMQLFYKVFRLWNSEPLAVLTGIALGTSILSIALNLPKKVTFFAMARRTGDEEEGDIDMGIRSRSGGHGGQIMYTSEVTVVYFRLPNTEKKSIQRLSVESSAFYSSVISSVKRSEGTVVHLHGPDVLAVFNAPKPLEEHWQNALECCFELLKSLKQFRVKPLVVVTTEMLPVGTLGSQSRKSFQVCGGIADHLSRISTLVAAVRDLHGIVATKKILVRLEKQDFTSTYKLKHIPTLVDEVLFEVIRKDAGENLAAQATSTVSPSKSTAMTLPVDRSHQICEQARLLPLFGLTTNAEIENETRLMNFLCRRLSNWLAAEEGRKGQAFNRIGDEQDIYGALGLRGEWDSGSDGSSDDEHIKLSAGEPHPPEKEKGEHTPKSSGSRLRTPGFILGHVLKPSRKIKELTPETIEL